jgi:hypothetical protein
LSAALSGQRAILLTWTYGSNADFQVFWKSSSPPGQEYVLLATTNAFSYTTADLYQSKTYDFYVRANVGGYFYYSNVVELFVSCGKGVVLSGSPPDPPPAQIVGWVHKYSDNFNRADINPLASPWGDVLDHGIAVPRLRIYTNVIPNVCTGTVDSTHNMMYYNMPLKDNQYSEVDISGSSVRSFGVFVRMNQSGVGYVCWRVNSVSPQVRLVTWNNGAYADLIPSIPIPSLVGRLRLEAKGTVLTVLFNDVIMQSYDDAVPRGGYSTILSGKAGLYITTNFNSGLVFLDNWSAGDWAGPL